MYWSLMVAQFVDETLVCLSLKCPLHTHMGVGLYTHGAGGSARRG